MTKKTTSKTTRKGRPQPATSTTSNSPADSPEKPEPNDYIRELAALKVQDHELDSFAYYFSKTFEEATEPATVLVELLERLKTVGKSPVANLESVIDHIQDRLFSECVAGSVASCDFVEAAGRNTAAIFKRWRVMESR